MSNIGLISENDNSTVLTEYTGLNRVATSFQSEEALEKELINTLIEQGYERLTINNEDELTQKEVADILGISQSYISRIEKKVIKRLSSIIKI